MGENSMKLGKKSNGIWKKSGMELGDTNPTLASFTTEYN